MSDRDDVKLLGETLFHQERQRVFAQTDRLFAGLMIAQWFACVAAALWITPRTWAGTTDSVHVHVWAAVLLGGAITLPPVLLVARRPGAPLTRHTIAVCQALTSALLIHLTGGRIETHFHIFGSLAFLAFYRDWRVLVTATVVVGIDHCVRGIYFPRSVFGVVAAGDWRWLEHVGWVVFEDLFLVRSCLQGLREMRQIAFRQASLEVTNASIERKVEERTESLRRNEQRLQETADELVEKNRALEEASARAMQAAEAKAAFLATMSHEIRTPLNAVIGMTGIVLDTKLDDEQQELLEIVRTSGDSLLTVVNDILDFSKIDTDNLELESIEFDVASVVETVGDLLAPQAHSKGVELAYLVRSGLPSTLVGDPGRLQQILLNFVSNAIKFTREGEVFIEVSTAAENDDEVTVLLSVHDTGIGIPEEYRSRLFQPFSQVDASNAREFGGTGLGLVIARRLAELHGGEAGCRSEIGAGSTFWFTARCRRGSESARSEPAAVVPEPRRILVVDDNATNRRIARYHLERLGHSVVDAESGRDALEVLRAHAGGDEPFDAAILDFQMPHMDGLELAREVQGDPALCGLPLVLLTSVVCRFDRETLASAGISAYLTKPLKAARFRDCVISLFSGSAAASPDRPKLITAESLADDEMRARFRILVVEDNPVNQRVAARQLQKLGYRCEVAASGDEALETLARMRFDLVLMDCQMPGIDGYEATRRQRENEQRSGQHVPIVAMTANALDGSRERCLAAGMDDFVTKPVDINKLAATLEQWLRPDLRASA